MREGWKDVSIGDIARVVGGGTPKSGVREFWGGDVQWLTPKDLADRPARYTARGARTITQAGLQRSGARLLPAGTVLLTSRAPVGYVSVASGPVATNQGFKSLVLEDGQVPEFWYYLLGGSTELLRANSGGSTFQEISGGALKNLRFTIPPQEQQRRIVDLMGAVDNALEAASPHFARAAYDALLATFAGGSTQAPLSEAVSLRRPEVVVVPEGTYRILGLRRSGEGFIDRGVIRGSDTGYSKLARLGADEFVYRKLTAWEGPLSVSTEAEVGGLVSPEFPVFAIKTEVLRPALLRHLCRWPGLWSRIENRLVGSVQRRKRLNPEALVHIQVPLPELSNQDTWLETLDAMWSLCQERSAEQARLRELRSNLLTALLSGETEIPNTYDRLVAG